MLSLNEYQINKEAEGDLGDYHIGEGLTKGATGPPLLDVGLYYWLNVAGMVVWLDHLTIIQGGPGSKPPSDLSQSVRRELASSL